MTDEAERTDGSASAVLRAVGSLLMALSQSESKAIDRIVRAVGVDTGATLEAAAPPSMPSVPAATEPPVAATPTKSDNRSDVNQDTAPEDEVELILADAREQAQRILDESMERARSLIEERHFGVSERAIREVKGAVTELTTEVRQIQQRLDRIEALLRDGRAGTTAAAGRALPPPPARRVPTFEPPAAEPVTRPTPRAAALEPPVTPAPAPQPAPVAPAPTYVPPAPVEPESPVAIPPMVETPAPTAAAPEPGAPRAVAPPPAAIEDEVEPAPLAPPPPPPPPRSAVPPVRGVSAPPPSAPVRAAETDADGAPIATFLPDEGTLILRVMPVSGFQGLMRVQDALARLPYVRHAAVEAYSQGEARLRIELMEPTDSDEIAAGLSERLHEPAHVKSASETDRELLIALR
ncbi:MAG: hypothetical protein AMXMBFR23_05980 [Chloroflexota bacterium]